MAIKYHINEAGEPGECHARTGNCPFGGDDKHFTSSMAARSYYESTQKTFHLSQREMNAQAKTTDDAQLISELIVRGSTRTLRNLAKNPNLSLEQAKQLLSNTDDVAARATIYSRPDLALLSWDELSPLDAEEIARRIPKHESSPCFYPADGFMARFMMSPTVTEEHYDRLALSPVVPDNVKGGLARMLQEKNRIPKERTERWLLENNFRRYPLNPDRALMSGKLTEDFLKNVAPDSYLEQFSAVGPSPNFSRREVDMLARVGMARGHHKLVARCSTDHRISAKALNELARGGFVTEELFNNPKLPRETRQHIGITHGGEVYVQVGLLKDRIGKNAYEQLYAPGPGKTLGRAYHENTLLFDVEQVKRYGLTREQIFYIAGARGYNAGVSYDEESGVFTGRVDSGD